LENLGEMPIAWSIKTEPQEKKIWMGQKHIMRLKQYWKFPTRKSPGTDSFMAEFLKLLNKN
jgi:hypothetical protein